METGQEGMEMGQGVERKWGEDGDKMWREGVGGQEERQQMEEAEPPAANASGQDGNGGWQWSGAGVGPGWRDGKREWGGSRAGV